MRRFPRDAVLIGWKEITEVFGLSERRVQEIARREDWPIVKLTRLGDDEGDGARGGGLVMLSGEAFHTWMQARSLGYSRKTWRRWIADRFTSVFERVLPGGMVALEKVSHAA